MVSHDCPLPRAKCEAQTIANVTLALEADLDPRHCCLGRKDDSFGRWFTMFLFDLGLEVT